MSDPIRSTGVFPRELRGAERLLERPWFQGVVSLLILACAVALLVPNRHRGDPEVGQADVGAIAARDIVMPRDFTHSVVDERATAEKRDQAAAAVRPVYDYRLEVKEAKLGRVQAAFALAREAPAAGQPRPEELRDRFHEELDETLAPEEFDAVAATGFARDVEEALVYLLGEAMRFKLLGTARQLEPIQRAGGIDLRILRGPTAIDEVAITSFEDFATIKQASEKIAEKARQGLKGLDPHLRDLLVGIASRMVATNCQHDELETQSRRRRAAQAVQELVTTTQYQAGQILVDRGHKVEQIHVAIYLAAFRPGGGADLAQVAVGIAALLLMMAVSLYRFSSVAIRKFARERRDVLFLGVWTLLVLAGARVGAAIAEPVADTWGSVSVTALQWLFPIAAAPMLVRLVINSETALVFTALCAPVVALAFDAGISYVIYAWVGGVVAAGAAGYAKTRMEVLSAGLKAGLANAVMAACAALIGGRLWSAGALFELALALAGGVVAGLLVTAVTPVVETLFGYTTNVKLLEMANLNNPLLKDLAIRAPGTFHHSILTGTLAEAGAESIRANPLLARVGAYYHDVGKAKCPPYFAENQKAENPHDKLKPSMSALILKDHVKDGVRILKEAGYPRPIVDICAQHLGTTLIQYFHDKARTAATEDGLPPPNESDYRYPGPKPQTREAALVFLADSVEAAAKSIPEPTHDRLKGMVHKVINQKFLDGQFEECDLTLKDLHAIAAAFTRVVTGIYHHRPLYPHQKEEEAALAKGDVRRSGESRKPGKKEAGAGLSANGNGRGEEGDRPANGDKARGEDPGSARPL